MSSDIPPEAAAPAIVLVEPQLGENIGAAARAMANFALSDLRLVRPRAGWPSAKARAMASGANAIIDAARVFDSAEAAIADLRAVYATTARNRGLPKPVMGPRAAASELRGRAAQGQATGILFGRERWGLTNEEVALADAIVTYPVNPKFASLNIAQAVLLMSYEWAMAEGGREVLAGTGPEPASKAHLFGLMRHLEQALDRTSYFRTAEMRPTMVHNLRAILQRMGLATDEIDVLHGVVGALEQPRADRQAGAPDG